MRITLNNQMKIALWKDNINKSKNAESYTSKVFCIVSYNTFRIFSWRPERVRYNETFREN